MNDDRQAAGLTNYLVAYALLELTRLKEIADDSIAHQLRKVIQYADEGQVFLEDTNRRPQAAKCANQKGEAAYLLAQEPGEDWLIRMSQAITAQAEAIRLLAKSREVEKTTLEQRFAMFRQALEGTLSRQAL